MSIWGKIVGGAAGFALGGPLGALIGAAVGHGVDRIAEDAVAIESGDQANGQDNTRKIAFTIGVIALGAKMAKADGRVTRDEVTAFRQVFHVPPAELENVGRVFNLARRDSAGFEPYARQIAGMFHDRPAVLEDLLACLFHIAQADGALNEHEIRFLEEVARIFGFDEAAFERLRAAEAGPDAADPYRILGIDREADNGAVKAAWRRLSRESHPDRLIAEGLPQEFVDIATSRMASINAAYDRIARERGMR
ncbi:MAG TPA: TerB family tellurite resistance protein [Alphaproteobacteria bacterium]|nr:TerB family tellurite resistance protein [Alphaproteobacteria bacterium]